jgi:hypothetical protein
VLLRAAMHDGGSAARGLWLVRALETVRALALSTHLRTDPRKRKNVANRNV